MDEQIKSKKTLITFGSILSAVAFIIFVAIIVLYDCSLISCSDIGLTFCWIGAIASFVICIVLRRQTPKPLKQILLGTNVLTFLVFIVALPLSTFHKFGDAVRENRRREGQELATIENAIEKVKNSTLVLHNEISKDSQIKCYDDNDTVKEAFTSFEFTYKGIGYYNTKTEIYFELYKMTIYFSNDCEFVSVYVPAERTMLGGGHDEGVNTYTLSKQNAKQIKTLIDDKISQAIGDYQQLYDSEKDKMSMNDALNYFDCAESHHRITYLENPDATPLIKYDEEHIANTRLKVFDFSTAISLTEYDLAETAKPDITFSDDRNYTYKWRYYIEQKLMRIDRSFLVPYEGTKTISASYLLTDTLSKNLVDIVKDTFNVNAVQ